MHFDQTVSIWLMMPKDADFHASAKFSTVTLPSGVIHYTFELEIAVMGLAA